MQIEKEDNKKNQTIDEFFQKTHYLLHKNNYKLIAHKIIDILKSNKNDLNISSKRLVHELFQNATDARFDNEKISIKIILSDDKLEFQHNGKYFYIENLLGLIQQVSSKNYKSIEQTGKFGTGFIATHLLSDIINVKGVLYIKENDFRDFEIKLDRTEKEDYSKLAEKIEESVQIFFEIDKRPEFKPRDNYLKNRKETDYDTCFTFFLTDKEKKQIARESLDDLINTIPATLITQYKKIKQITIIDKKDKTETIYSPKVENENKNDITESFVKKTTINNGFPNETNINFLTYLKVNNDKEILRLLLEVQKKDGKIIILQRDKSKPVLYRNFPLIGSNEFHMPFITDGFNFNPLETRNGIFLNGGNNKNNLEVQENLDIMEQAYASSIEFISCILKKFEKNLVNRHLLALNKFPKPFVNFDSFSENWFYEKQKAFREKLKDFYLVECANNKLSKLSDLILPIFKGKCDKDFYNLVFNLNIRNKNCPNIKYYYHWYNIIIQANTDIPGLRMKDNKFITSWGISKNEKTGEEEINYIYDEKNFLQDLSNCKNIKTLCKNPGQENEVILKIIETIKFFKKDKNSNYVDIFNKYPIIPNRNGDFKKLEELYTDEEKRIPLQIIVIYDSILEKKLNEELIDNKISIRYLGDVLKKKDFDYTIKHLNEYIIKNEDSKKVKEVAYKLLSIKSDNNEEISTIYNFLSLFYNSEQIVIENEKIPNDLWAYSLKFWYREFPKEIESYKDIDTLKGKFLNDEITKKEVLQWLNSFFEFLNSHSDRNFEKLIIFPNQNGKFCDLKSLHYDSGFPEEFKEILKNYFKIDKREILFDKLILTYSSFNILPENKITKEIENKFNELKNNEIQNNEKLLKLAIEISCLYPENVEQKQIKNYLEKIILPERTDEQLKTNPLEYLGFAEIVYNKKNDFKIKKIKTNDLKYLIFINYLIEKICDEIGKAGNFDNIKKNFCGIETQEDLEKFLLKIIRFIWDNQNNKEYPIKSCIDHKTSEKAIFLNKYNELVPLKSISFKEESNLIGDEENEKILFQICKNKLIKEDPNNKLLNKYLNRNLSDYKVKFECFKIDDDLCKAIIDTAIMDYDQNNKNSGKQYCQDFYDILRDLNKLKCDKDIIKKLFPYYSRNKSNLTINCLDKDKTEQLISKITADNFEDQIKLLEHFKDKDSIKKFNECLEMSGDEIDNLTSALFGVKTDENLKLNFEQKFSFKFKFFDENGKEKVIKNTITLNPEEIPYFRLEQNKYINTIEFEIDSFNDNPKNDEIKITYKKNNLFNY